MNYVSKLIRQYAERYSLTNIPEQSLPEYPVLFYGPPHRPAPRLLSRCLDAGSVYRIFVLHFPGIAIRLYLRFRVDRAGLVKVSRIKIRELD